jgi:aconitate hydratase 2/2-methylisocitrate dehydratase
MLKAYREHAAERAALGIPPLPLDAKQVESLIELIKSPPAGEDAFLMDLLTHRVPPGVDDAAKVKASFLAAVAHGDLAVGLISKAKATELLGTMVGGYNVHPLIELLDDAEVAGVAAAALKKTLLMFDFFNDVAEKAKAGNAFAKDVMQSWADAEWFTSRPEVPKNDHGHRVQGAWRNQHRRPVTRARCLEPPRHPAALSGHAQKHPSRRGFQARRRRQARPHAVH